mgnify:CR=1 FL=1
MDNGQNGKAPGWWAVGGRYAERREPGGSLSATRPTNFGGFRCFSSFRTVCWTCVILWQITGPLGCGICAVSERVSDVRVSQGNFEGNPPEVVAFPRQVRRLPDPQLFNPHDQTPRRRALRAMRRAEARAGISKRAGPTLGDPTPLRSSNRRGGPSPPDTPRPPK